MFNVPWGRQPRRHSLPAVREVSGLLCVSLCKGSSLPSRLSAQSGLVLQRARRWLASSLSGALPRPCLSVCLPVCFGLPACPSVVGVTSLLSWRFRGLGSSVLLQGPKSDTGLGPLADELHTRFIISVNILSRAPVGVSLALIRASAKRPHRCPITL